MSAEDLFARLLAAGQVTRANQVASNSTKTYGSFLRVYESTVRPIPDGPLSEYGRQDRGDIDDKKGAGTNFSNT